MRQTSLASIAPPVVGIPAVLSGGLPAWCLVVLLGVSTLLSTVQVVATQVIRLRASQRVTRSQDNLEVLRIEDLPRFRRQPQ
jgi:hypothetical protein